MSIRTLFAGAYFIELCLLLRSPYSAPLQGMQGKLSKHERNVWVFIHAISLR